MATVLPFLSVPVSLRHADTESGMARQKAINEFLAVVAILFLRTDSFLAVIGPDCAGIEIVY